MLENYDQIKTLRDELFKRYKKLVLNKRELAQEMGVSVSFIDKSLARGYGIPNYIKLGHASNGMIMFNVVDVANYLSCTLKMG